MEINSIVKYDSSYDLIMEECSTIDLTPEEIDCLEMVNEFDPVCYYLINDEIVVVCDSITGTKSGTEMNLDEFFQNVIDYIREEMI